MIVDTVAKWEGYRFGKAWEDAFTFLATLTPDAAEGRYEIEGDGIFAMVMSYDTKEPADAVLEAHRKYVDIQTVLVGREGCEWFPVEGLATQVPYDAAKDVQFFLRPSPGPVRIDIAPGTFVTFFPHDAHMPALVVGGARERIKKVVVKIAVELLTV